MYMCVCVCVCVCVCIKSLSFFFPNNFYLFKLPTYLGERYHSLIHFLLFPRKKMFVHLLYLPFPRDLIVKLNNSFKHRTTQLKNDIRSDQISRSVVSHSL